MYELSLTEHVMMSSDQRSSLCHPTNLLGKQFYTIFCSSTAMSVSQAGFNPLTPNSRSMGRVTRPGAPRHNIICNSFFLNFQADISSLQE